MPRHYSVVVIGSGFGGSAASLRIAQHFKDHPEKRTAANGVLLLERGTWWTTPTTTLRDKDVRTYSFLKDDNGQPVQFWSSQNHFRGLIDILSRCFRRPGNQDGLYDVMTMGRRFLWFGSNDGVTILRACGVGGGSLIYSNITIRPPELIFKDPRWGALSWTEAERTTLYARARQAIGSG
ncbi:MAG: hypothetical protein ACJ8J0_24365, partial [Longimicrobiaceae bacterium]